MGRRIQIMNKFEYLSKLKGYLSKLPAKERNAALKYYDELFKDAGPENEESVIMSLGSPQKLAHRILTNNSGISESINQTRKGMRNVRNNMSKKQTILAILLMIVTFPVWGAILLAISAIIVLIFAAAMLVLITVLICGIVLICTGVAQLFKVISIGTVLIGLGIVFGSVVFLLFIPITNFSFFLIKKILNGCIKIFNKIIRKTEARAR